ncbi:MAG: hypothetical protein IJ787_02325, partial [Bacilli bacterium]|nr:hypothetical protein [Bacilli bacterium]
MPGETMDEKQFRELQKKYDDLALDYIRKKFEIKDRRKQELEDLRDEYKIRRLEVETPLKAEKYRRKVEAKKL